MNQQHAIEYFHLSFANRLAAKMDRKLFCLKGGCNLRFYFRSIRYSEDIDFDICITSIQILKKNVEKILNDENFQTLLEHENITIVEWSAPKQTETTQRWKVNLKIDNQVLSIPTKIEFSRRKNNFHKTEIQFVNPALITNYKLQPVLLQHYELSAAIEQKITALLYCAETQARDVLDLKILIDQQTKPEIFFLSTENKKKALETLMSVSFDQFKSQVWPYLMPEYQEHYKEQKIWNQIQEDVLSFLQKQSGT